MGPVRGKASPHTGSNPEPPFPWTRPTCPTERPGGRRTSTDYGLQRGGCHCALRTDASSKLFAIRLECGLAMRAIRCDDGPALEFDEQANFRVTQRRATGEQLRPPDNILAVGETPLGKRNALSAKLRDHENSIR